MNFERTNTKISLLEDYYTHFDEDHRLKTRHGNVEFITSIKYIDKYLNQKGQKLLDLGAGTGAYSVYYADKGFDVTALEIVEHNVEQIKVKSTKVKAILGNAIDLSKFSNQSFDVILIFGPLYHLLKREDKIKCLTEAKRVLKDDGVIISSYYMNDYAIVTYGFIKKHILDSINDGRVDESFHMVNKDDDLYSMVRIDDIDDFNQEAGLKREKIVAADGPSNYLRVVLNSLSEEEYQKFIEYHLSTCERSDLLGASSHLIDIVRKA